MYADTTEISGARLAAIILSSLSAIASLIVVVSYVRMLLQFRAHQRRIIEASMGASGGISAVPPAACFSCESSLATPGVNKTHFFSPQNRHVRQLNSSIHGQPMQNIPMQAVLNGIPAVGSQRSSMPPPLALQGAAASMRTRTSSRATSCGRPADDDVGSYHSKPHSIAAALSLSAGNADTFRGWAKHHPARSRVPPLTLQPLSIAAERKPHQPQSSLEIVSSPIDTNQPPRRSLVRGRELLARMLPRRGMDRTAGNPTVLDIFGGRRRRKLPRIPSSKIAVLSGIDFLLHALWIVNTMTAGDVGGCTATLFFYQWIQLFYLFFLAAFASRSAMRLRNLQPIQPRKQRRTDMLYSCSTLAASLALSVLPAIMATAQHDDELDVCWFARGTSISLRWVWVTLNIWVVLSLLFLIATSIYVGVILSNERRDLMSFMHSSAARVSANGGSAEHIKGDGAQMPSFYYPSMGARHSQVPVNYYYNRSNLVVDVPSNSVGMGFCARSTPLASRESLGLSRGGNEVSPGAAPPSGNGSKCRPAPLMIYPANHPISLAHEALHGRRPLTSRSRDSALKSSDCSRHPTGVSAHRTAHSPMAQYSGRTSSSGHSVCESCKRSPSTGIQSERSLRHHSEIISAARYYSLSRQQWGVGMSSSGVADRMHYCRPLSSGLVYMVGNDSESRISAALPWDSSRRLIHKPSYASTTAATSQGQRASPLASDRPLYGFYAQRSVAAPVAGKCNGQKCRRMAKHMSMPVPCGSVGCHGYSTSPVEPESSEGCATYMATRHARQLSMPPDTQQSSRQSGATCTQVGQGRWYGSQPFSTGAGEAAAPLGLMPRPSLAQMGAAKAAGGMGATAHVDSCPGKPPNVSGDGTKARTGPKRGWGWSVGGLFCGGAGGKRGETQGQMQRIERRVHMLVATGALRVATRAMVPLVTQLCMVVWSTMHALNAAGVQTVYSAAILLLSTQGLLDMALYHIFDTQADDSDVSLPSGIPLSSLNAGSASSGKAERSFAPHRRQSHAATPRASHDRASSNWHRHGRASAEAKRWVMNRSHQRSISLTSGGSADRRFVFNVDSLNIRRADRTSNAMQSDTLHDGDVAWSHMDALSAHDTRSISQFSALGAHIQHQPVLSGWEEEESPRSSAHFPD